MQKIEKTFEQELLQANDPSRIKNVLGFATTLYGLFDPHSGKRMGMISTVFLDVFSQIFTLRQLVKTGATFLQYIHPVSALFGKALNFFSSCRDIDKTNHAVQLSDLQKTLVRLYATMFQEIRQEIDAVHKGLFQHVEKLLGGHYTGIMYRLQLLEQKQDDFVNHVAEQLQNVHIELHRISQQIDLRFLDFIQQDFQRLKGIVLRLVEMSITQEQTQTHIADIMSWATDVSKRPLAAGGSISVQDIDAFRRATHDAQSIEDVFFALDWMNAYLRTHRCYSANRVLASILRKWMKADKPQDK